MNGLSGVSTTRVCGGRASRRARASHGAPDPGTPLALLHRIDTGANRRAVVDGFIYPRIPLGGLSMSPQTLRSVVQYLKGLDLPSGKQGIIDTALRNRAPQDVVDVLQKIPDQVYQEMDDIWRELGKQI